ncbi:hypothetical protein [Pseudodesulfovibrio tunisiensis]|uniref:hypothetical protein n=1 Tax=Pseudodesulfovibrio tunisiensis TaxID=463192 RepID=UPI001FB2B145|nr:hypothetical protein [Pseudodesulfovibrio tunisiensis]
MSVWKVEIRKGEIRFGDRKRRMLTRNGCNEPFKDVFWCPRRQWFRREPCPFVNRDECSTFARLCGSL